MSFTTTENGCRNIIMTFSFFKYHITVFQTDTLQISKQSVNSKQISKHSKWVWSRRIVFLVTSCNLNLVSVITQPWNYFSSNCWHRHFWRYHILYGTQRAGGRFHQNSLSCSPNIFGMFRYLAVISINRNLN